MRPIVIGLVVLFTSLQYKLWLADNNVMDVWRLKQTLDIQYKKNNSLSDRNAALYAEVAELKRGQEAVEERARYDLGLIKRGEVYYQIID